MNDKDRETLGHISNTLDEVLAVLKKPGNRVLKILDITGNVVTIVGVLAIIDIIRKWV